MIAETAVALLLVDIKMSVNAPAFVATRRMMPLTSPAASNRAVKTTRRIGGAA